MSHYKEKQASRQENKLPRDASTSRKTIRDESRDGRPIVTQEKPTKIKTSKSSNDKGKTPTEKPTTDRSSKRRTEPKNEEKKYSMKNTEKVRRHEPELKSRRDAKKDTIYMKDVLENKIMKKMEMINKNMKVKSSSKKIAEKGEFRSKEKIKSRRERTRTRTLSPTEVKQLIPSKLAYELASGDSAKWEVDSSSSVNSNETECKSMAGKDEEIEVEEDDYEEDFENYESDFEEDEDREEQEEPSSPPNSVQVQYVPLERKQPQIEQKPVDVDEQWKVEARKKEIEAIKKSIEKENYNLSERRNTMPRPEEEENDSDKENIKIIHRGGKIIDFSNAIKKQKKAKKVAASRKRGEELLSMISLDSIYYAILEIPPIPYDEFMKTFGKSNSKQVHVQTNEDNLDEEIQTDYVSVTNKWTQHPAEYLGRQKNGFSFSYVLTKEERLGVGEDISAEEDEELTIQPKTNGLWTFLTRASQIVLNELERGSSNFFSLDNMPNHSKAMVFGDGFVQLNVKDVPFLNGRSVSHLSLLSQNVGKLLSVHVNKEKKFQKSIVCLWSLRELSKPLRILVASNRITSCCFGVNQGNLVFAGLSDGSVCLWDLRESSVYHNRTVNNPEWVLQPATYTTAGNLIDEGHSGQVVSVRTLEEVDGNSGFINFMPMQICTLDDNGTFIIWSVIQTDRQNRNAPCEDLGLAHWGRVKLIKSSSFSIFASLRDEIPGLYITCKDFLINASEEDGFYVANSLGSVHHCSSYGSLMKPKFYVPTKQDTIIETTCLELCPFDGNYFLVGCGDGTIRLHSRHQENPLICLNPNSAGEEEAAVVSLNWMRMRPCVFFALDSKSRIHIWDLGVSDMYPEISISLSEKRISCMKLLPISNTRQNPYVVIGTEDGSIEIHKLKKKYGCKSASDIQNEMKMFLKYVSIL